MGWTVVGEDDFTYAIEGDDGATLLVDDLGGLWFEFEGDGVAAVFAPGAWKHAFNG